MTGCIDNQPKNTGTLLLGPARLFGVIRIGGRNRLRGRDAATNLVDAATDAAATAGSYAGTVANAYTAAGTRTDPTTGTGAVRRWRSRHDRSCRCSKIRHMIVRNMNLRRNHDRWFSGEFGLLIPHNDCGRSDLLQSCFRQTSIGSRESIVV